MAQCRYQFAVATMMRALLAKELRTLRPLAFCIVGLLALIVLFTFATELPDAHPLDPEKWLGSDRSGAFAVIGLFGLMIGAGLLVSESEQGTLSFLDGLPLSRTRLFAAKVLAALAVVATVPVLGLSIDTALGWLSRSSTDDPFPWKFVFIQLGLEVIVGAYIVALALVLSFLRKWFALAAGLLLMSYLLARQGGVPWIALFDPYELLGVAVQGSRVLVSWLHFAVQVGTTLVLLAVAWAGFLHLGDRTQFAGERFGRWRVLRTLGTAMRFLAPLVWIGAIVVLVGTSDRGAARSTAAPLGEDAFAHQQTTRFEFLFRSAQREKAAPLLAAADEVHDAVAGFFDTPPPPTRIVVDLASPLMPHFLGQTNWTKIRLPIDLSEGLAEQRQILGHETAHVFIEQLSDARLGQHFRWIRCFHEGLATHVEQELFADAEQHAKQRRNVAAVWSRGAVAFPLLSDNAELIRTRDLSVAYPLGEVFARSLIETHGRPAVAKLLRAFARENGPMGLGSVALWRDAMQAAGLNFDRVVAAYETTCATIASEEEAFVTTLPRLSATVSVKDQDVVIIRPKFTGTAPGELLCLVEVDDLLRSETVSLSRQPDGDFTMPRSRLLKPVFRYILGWRIPETTHPIFEPWSSAVR